MCCRKKRNIETDQEKKKTREKEKKWERDSELMWVFLVQTVCDTEMIATVLQLLELSQAFDCSNGK